MRTIILFFLTFFYTIIINSAQLKMEAFGKSKTRVFNLTDGSIFLTYSSESVVTNNIGITHKPINAKTCIMPGVAPLQTCII